MTKLTKTLLIILSFGILANCHEEGLSATIPPIDPAMSTTASNDLKVIWKKKIYPEGISDLSIVGHTEIFDKGIASWKQGLNNTHDTLLLLDKTDGSPIWKWSDFVRPLPQDGSSGYDFYHDGIYCVSSHQDNYGVDVQNGNTVWAFNKEHVRGYITGNSDGLVFKTQTVRKPKPYASIFIGDYQAGNFQEELRMYSESEGYDFVGIHNVSSFKNEKNETILIFFFQQEGYFDNSYRTTVDYFAYNLKERAILWKRKALNPSGRANKTPPVIDEHAVYVGGAKKVYKLDRNTGETIWERELPWGFSFDIYTQYKERLIFNLGNGNLMAISKETGNTIWENVGLSGCCAVPIVIGERIYFANGAIHIVDVNSGDELYRFDPKHGSYLSNPAIDLENKKMYGTDGVYFYCWELPY